MLQLRVGNSKHFVTLWNAKKLPRNAKRYGLQWFGSNQQHCYDKSDRSIVAYFDGRLVGFFRFNYQKRKGYNRLSADGTWVDPSFRRTGLARKMWERAFKKYAINRVHVIVTTKAGLRFVDALQTVHSDIEFDVMENT